MGIIDFGLYFLEKVDEIYFIIVDVVWGRDFNICRLFCVVYKIGDFIVYWFSKL